MANELSNLIKWPPLLALVLLAGTFVTTVAGGNTAIYWSLNGDDDSSTLVEACNSGLHSFVILSNVSKSGGAGIHTSTLNVRSSVSSEAIEACQSLEVKVLLAIGGEGNSSTTGDEDASSVASYLWNTFLGGSSASRPLDDAVLDGITFDTDETGSNARRYEEQARSLSQLSGQASQGRKLYLTAAPVMPYPGALKVASLLDGVRGGGLPRNVGKRYLYMYFQIPHNGKEDAGLPGTRLEKGYYVMRTHGSRSSKSCCVITTNTCKNLQ